MKENWHTTWDKNVPLVIAAQALVVHCDYEGVDSNEPGAYTITDAETGTTRIVQVMRFHVGWRVEEAELS